MENTTKEKPNLKSRIAITILASVILPFTVFVAIPISVFANNISEFLFNWSDFVPLCLGFAVLLATAIFFAIFFLPEKAYKICLHVLIALGFLAFAQSTYLNGNLSLSGDGLGGVHQQPPRLLISYSGYL